MLIRHRGRVPTVDPSAYVAPNAVLCGDVRVGPAVRVLFGATLVAEGGPIEIGAQTVVMSNALVQASRHHPTRVGAHVLIGPHTNISGAIIEDDVFVATGACVFNGASVGARSVLRINSVVHIRTKVPPDTAVPIGWIAVGEPFRLLPPSESEAFVKAMHELGGFAPVVFGLTRPADAPSVMPLLAARYSSGLGAHFQDEMVS